MKKKVSLLTLDIEKIRKRLRTESYVPVRYAPAGNASIQACINQGKPGRGNLPQVIGRTYINVKMNGIYKITGVSDDFKTMFISVDGSAVKLKVNKDLEFSPDEAWQKKNSEMLDTIKFLNALRLDPEPIDTELCTFNFNTPFEKTHAAEFPFSKHQTFIFHGEIRQMPGHCIISDIQTGQLYSGYHTYNFKPIVDEDA